MIGYHYTTFKNFLSIQREGLKPYLISHEKFDEAFGLNPVNGIWVFTRKLSNLEHNGNILIQMANKNSKLAVLLAVEYLSKDKMKYSLMNRLTKAKVEITLRVSLGGLSCMQTKDVVVLKNTIPPERINLLGIYNLNDELTTWEY